MTDTTHMTDAGGTDESRISEARARGVAKMNEVYGWELPADVPGDFFAGHRRPPLCRHLDATRDCRYVIDDYS